MYNEATKRTQYSTVPTSSITAEAVTVDGFALLQKDTAGITTTASRQYTASGIIHMQTDGRGNATTTVTDLAGRTTSVTDAAGNTTTTAYDAHHDAPATITDALGNTSCYRYDERGRKVAEWGAAVQPACFGYDEADNMTSLTTFRHPQEVIRTAYTYAPYGEVTAAGDVTQPVQWSSEYNDAELGLIYYNYRHYNSVDGRWLGRDKLGDKVFHNLYALVVNAPATLIDVLRLRALTPAEQKLIACIQEQMKAQCGTCSENLAGQISQMLKDYTAAIQKSGKKDSPSLKARSYALSVFCNQIKKKYAQKKDNGEFYCSSFARDVLSATGLKLKSKLSASYFLNSGDKDMAREGYKVKFVDEANREPGDIIVGGSAGTNGAYAAHIGVYIGNELYISQSPSSQYDQLVGQAPGMKIRDVSTLPYPDIKYREIQK